MHIVRRIAAVALMLVLVSSLAGCTSRPKAGSPEAAVQSLLELRSKLTTDAAKYASYVATPMAEALATDSASRLATDVPIPQWNTPKVTEETTAAAKVTVRWKANAAFGNWAKVTVFSLNKVDGHWVVVDANVDTGSKATTSTP